MNRQKNLGLLDQWLNREMLNIPYRNIADDVDGKEDEVQEVRKRVCSQTSEARARLT
jgi:hypothetical protein